MATDDCSRLTSPERDLTHADARAITPLDTPLRTTMRQSPVNPYPVVARETVNGVCADLQRMNNQIHDLVEELAQARAETATLQNQVCHIRHSICNSVDVLTHL